MPLVRLEMVLGGGGTQHIRAKSQYVHQQLFLIGRIWMNSCLSEMCSS